MEENKLKKKVGRPRKYNTDEERKQAIQVSKKNYMRKIRATLQPKKRGRHQKYFTDEERRIARKATCRKYYLKHHMDDKSVLNDFSE